MTDLAVAPSLGVSAPQALAGIRVVEVGFAAAGPLVGKYLANHGAEVIKLESSRAPDVFRSTYPPFKDNVPGPDRAAMFAFYNDGKRSVTLDLKHPRGMELARALVAKSDVLIESFPAGTMAKRGLAYPELIRENPGLVMLSSCNQGQTGPHAQHPGYGSQLTCLAGFVHLLGERERAPVFLYGPYIDYIAVGYGVIGVLAGLARRAATGRGTYIDLSQYEAGLQFMTPAFLEHELNGTVPTRAGNDDPIAIPHGVYPCKADTRDDRWVALSVWSDEEWVRFREAIGDPAWARERRWDGAAGRRAARAELDERIGEWTRGRTRDAVVSALRSRGLRAAAVETISELFADGQLAHRGLWRALPHPVIGTVQCLSAPFTLSATPSRQEHAGPTLGADNDHVFGTVLGVGEEERAALARDGVFA
ncbi:MAG: CoA transferase [Chloroflexota bacterium]|nr:CoA transferase [Chloroflexota bacterium]MDE3193861.1 CoA transferase [Chloroflexota bacterium]